MSDKPVNDLRRRLIADMTIRTFSDKTQRDYIWNVEAFASVASARTVTNIRKTK
jgi:hypothetical protein